MDNFFLNEALLYMTIAVGVMFFLVCLGIWFIYKAFKIEQPKPQHQPTPRHRYDDTQRGTRRIDPGSIAQARVNPYWHEVNRQRESDEDSANG